MTSNTRMSNFRRMAERLALGQKLLTTQEKTTVMMQQVYLNKIEMEPSSRFSKIRLVLNPGKKRVPH